MQEHLRNRTLTPPAATLVVMALPAGAGLRMLCA